MERAPDYSARGIVGQMANNVAKFLDSNSTLIDPPHDGVINLPMFQGRDKLISDITAAMNALFEVKNMLDAALQRAKNNRGKEVAIMDALLHGYASAAPQAEKQPAQHAQHVQNAQNVQKSPVDQHPQQPRRTPIQPTAQPWQMVVRRKAQPAPPSQPVPATQPAPQPVPQPQPQQPPPQPAAAPVLSKINITNALCLNAVRVHTFDDVAQDGNLYYVVRANHFAFRINGLLFHGNIGLIYTNEESPQKIRDCKFGPSCMKNENCNYYHSPKTFNGSTDRRNFIASSWLYSPASISDGSRKIHGRRFGSLNNLDTDIVLLSNREERNRTYDAAMHDLLCAVLLRTSYADE